MSDIPDAICGKEGPEGFQHFTIEADRDTEGICICVIDKLRDYPALLPWRTVAHNVRLPLELRGQTPNDKDVKKALEDVGLKAWSEQRPHELSGGMQQRVALARALVAKPKVLLLDEPFSQLDELLRFELLFQMLNYANAFGSTVMFVTHDVSEAVIAADVIYILSDRPVLSAERIDVLLPRPRTLLTTDQPLFHKLVSEVRTILKQQKCKV